MTNIVLFVSDCRYIFDIRSRYNGWLAHSWLFIKEKLQISQREGRAAAGPELAVNKNHFSPL